MEGIPDYRPRPMPPLWDDWYVLDRRKVRKARSLLDMRTGRHRNVWGPKALIQGWTISTVFLGLDHGYGEGAPVLFETMVFAPDDRSDVISNRYRTINKAEAGHAHCVAFVTRRLRLCSHPKARNWWEEYAPPPPWRFAPAVKVRYTLVGRSKYLTARERGKVKLYRIRQRRKMSELVAYRKALKD